MLNNGKVKVDGYDPVTKTVYEFHGCQFHGCKKCKPNARHVKTFHHPDRTVEEMYQATCRKKELLREAGYTMIEQWDCDFRKELKQNEGLKESVKNMTWVYEMLCMEEELGWQNGTMKQKKRNKFITKISRVCTHPSISMGLTRLGIQSLLNQDISQYFGIAKVDVIAPEKLFHPVLPVKINEKLMFLLCKKCAEDQQSLPCYERQNTCPHSNEERMMTATWCTVELQRAVELGYRLIKIHELWHFNNNK